jgi:CubicO group peptidase (beta-lactamase class C family)
MAAGGVPGLSIGIVRDGDIVSTIAEGVRNATSGNRVDDGTVFEAASLTKPVLAYAVLQPIDAGALSLDDTLSMYLPYYVTGDRRSSTITVRHVLSHTTGLPNCRTEANPLRTYFEPGERFSYSGEGFVWLQGVIERVTGEPLESVMDRLVLAPLGMNHSALIWRTAFEVDNADPHDAALVPGVKSKPTEVKSASTLHTTARDYALFLRAALSGNRLSPAMARLWLGTTGVGPPAVHSMPHPPTRTGFACGVGIGVGFGARCPNILPVGRQRGVQGLRDWLVPKSVGNRHPHERPEQHVDYARIDAAIYVGIGRRSRGWTIPDTMPSDSEDLRCGYLYRGAV